VKVPKQRSLEELPVDPISKVAGAAGGIEGVGRAIEHGPQLADEMLPSCLVAFGARACECEIFEMECRGIGAAIGGSLQRFSKALDRNTPAFGTCPLVETVDQPGV
jgi:hypothetical protein